MRDDREASGIGDELRPPSLSVRHRRTVQRIVDAAAPGVRAFIFGSRSHGRGRPFSDLDLLLERSTPLSWDERAALRDAFEASDLPFKVDVVVADDLAAGFRHRVLSERVPL